jgi:ketosteroid isomerase-like protein
MKQLIASAVIVLALALISAGQTSNPKRVLKGESDDAVGVNRQWLTALAKCDVPSLVKLTGDDFVITHLIGRVENKQQFISYLRGLSEDSCSPEGPIIEDVRVQSVGDVCVITCRIIDKGKNGETDELRYTNVYAKRGKRWQAITSHVGAVVRGEMRADPTPENQRS